MARRDEDECAWCAERTDDERRIVGRDWKVYCSPACVRAGESHSKKVEEGLRSDPPSSQSNDPLLGPGR